MPSASSQATGSARDESSGTCSRVSFLTVISEVWSRVPISRRARPVASHRRTAAQPRLAPRRGCLFQRSLSRCGGPARWRLRARWSRPGSETPRIALCARRSTPGARSSGDRATRTGARTTSASACPTVGYGMPRRRSPRSASRSASSRRPVAVSAAQPRCAGDSTQDSAWTRRRAKADRCRSTPAHAPFALARRRAA